MKDQALFPLYNKGEQVETPHPPPQKSQGLPQQAHARRVYIETYGCQMNVSDSELMAGILTQSGHQTVTHIDDADVVLVNTCAIRETRKRRLLIGSSISTIANVGSQDSLSGSVVVWRNTSATDFWTQRPTSIS